MSSSFLIIIIVISQDEGFRSVRNTTHDLMVPPHDGSMQWPTVMGQRMECIVVSDGSWRVR